MAAIDTPDDPDYVPAGAPDDYKGLPRSVRDLHPLEGWQWLSDAEKGRLVQTETEPEH